MVKRARLFPGWMLAANATLLFAVSSVASLDGSSGASPGPSSGRPSRGEDPSRSAGRAAGSPAGDGRGEGRGASGGLVRRAWAQAPSCTLRGAPIIAKTVEAFSAATGGEAIAKFTGQPVPMALTLPSGSGSRGVLRTGTGTGGFRLEGFLDPGDAPAFTTRNLPVVADHVWIGGPRRVKVAGASGGRVAVELKAGAPIEQTLRATAPCDAVSFDLPSFRQEPVPGSARGYLAKRSPLEVRGSASGPALFTFTSSDIADALLFWSTERTGGAVHVHLTGDVVVDGWVAAADLQALKVGEMMDALAPGTPTISSPRLMMQGTPTVVKASREVTVRRRPNDTAQIIGAVEPGGEVMVLETVLGWSNVVPTALVLMPPTGGGFWVKASELGSAPGTPPK
jgi:hypothetical protein